MGLFPGGTGHVLRRPFGISFQRPEPGCQGEQRSADVGSSGSTYLLNFSFFLFLNIEEKQLGSEEESTMRNLYWTDSVWQKPTVMWNE